ncbi:WD repeat domain-containing protein [Xylariaceae sp. FL1651]|nr:WD repeat domain-containing protein [Xylariaceae sp. FL1651]
MSLYRANTVHASSQGSLADDVALPSDGEDTISSLSWSPVANHLAAASWDGKVRIYDVASTGSARGVAALSAEGPIFDCDWAKDGIMVLAGGADKKIHLLHMPTGQQAIIGSHEAPVRGVRFVDVPDSNGPIIASGSWDKTVKLWDLRQPGTAVMTLACKERVYAMDSKVQLLVIATAERHIHLVDLKKPTVFLDTLESPMKHQTKTVSVSHDGKIWATAGIDGRCGINAVDKKETSKINFTFRCHREINDAEKVTKIWAVNDFQFHPVHHSTFATAGSDGTFMFWNRIAHTRLRWYPPVSKSGLSDGTVAITATSFSRDGHFYAYAVGYDWSRGHAGNSPQIQTKVMLHPVTKEDVGATKKK